MTNAAQRGLAGVLGDILSWLRMYKQRAFWIQIGATVLGVLLWVPFVFGLTDVALLVNLVGLVAFLCSIVTNIVWAGLRKPYSCVIGTIIGFGLFYLTWSVLVLQLTDSIEILLGLLKGFLIGALFGYMSFLVFAITGLIYIPRKRRLGSESSSESETKLAETKKE